VGSAWRDDHEPLAVLPGSEPLRAPYRAPETAESPLRLLRAEYDLDPQVLTIARVPGMGGASVPERSSWMTPRAVAPPVGTTVILAAGSKPGAVTIMV